VRNARAAALVSRTVGLIAALATATTVIVGGTLASRGALTPGDLLVFLSYVAALFKPVRDLGKLWSKFARARVSAERLGEFLQLEPDIRDLPGAVDAGHLAGELIFDRVTFSYGEGAAVLDEANLRIRAGEHVAVIGPSGAGKSTLLRLTLRLYETLAGRIVIDGRDIRAYTLESLRREVGVVLQDAVFVHASIATNIRYGNLDATDAEIEHAARLAGAHQFIMTLPQGYETIVGERGALLSGGQRQRVCLARTLIRDPAILILDEPTSAVDPASATLIERDLARCRRGRTTIVIGHQFSDLERFDRVLEVSGGRVTEVTKLRRSAGMAPARLVQVTP
jgi:ABC-type multidrug transport system fused ATPase/permease subunit